MEYVEVAPESISGAFCAEFITSSGKKTFIKVAALMLALLVFCLCGLFYCMIMLNPTSCAFHEAFRNLFIIGAVFALLGSLFALYQARRPEGLSLSGILIRGKSLEHGYLTATEDEEGSLSKTRKAKLNSARWKSYGILEGSCFGVEVVAMTDEVKKDAFSMREVVFTSDSGGKFHLKHSGLSIDNDFCVALGGELQCLGCRSDVEDPNVRLLKQLLFLTEMFDSYEGNVNFQRSVTFTAPRTNKLKAMVLAGYAGKLVADSIDRYRQWKVDEHLGAGEFPMRLNELATKHKWKIQHEVESDT